MATMRSKCMTGLGIENGQDIEVAATGKAYFDVTVSRSVDDDTHIIVKSSNGDSTVIGASSLVYRLDKVGEEVPTKHTAGPWELTILRGTGSLMIDQAGDKGAPDLATVHPTGVGALTAAANAARIVACVNACEGISNELLSHGQVQPLSRYSTVVDQRDELLECLLQALPHVEDDLESPVFKRGVREKTLAKFRAAIARAERKVQS